MREDAEDDGHEHDRRDLRSERSECGFFQGDEHEDDRRKAAWSEPANKQHRAAA